MSEKGEQIGVRVDAQLLARLNDWRRRQPDPPSKAEAIRQLVEQALGMKPRRSTRELLGE